MLRSSLSRVHRPVALAAALAMLCSCTFAPSSNRSSASPSATKRAVTSAGTGLTPAHSALRQRLARPSGGAVLKLVNIPASDGYRPRPAYIYLPPAAIAHPRQRLPVLELLHGEPGAPDNWIDLGHLIQTVNAFSSRHHGQAPVVVMPDLNGSKHADSQCIRTAGGTDTESYLTSDVSSWVRRHYGSIVGSAKWWIAGMSEGGVCSLMLALRHPQLYSALGDLSGLAAPLVNHLTRAASDQQLYRNDLQAKRQHEPLWLLAHKKYRGFPAWFECGSNDKEGLTQQAIVVAAARAAGLRTHVSFLPGGHRWAVWARAFTAMLPWLWNLPGRQAR